MSGNSESSWGQWQEIQNQSFLAWVNHYLDPVELAVTDFTTDLGDGLKLIALLEILSGVKFSRYVRNPRFPAQKLSNITEALEFMTRHYGIKFIGVNAQDIMDGKRNQCLGIIFLLINKVKNASWETKGEQYNSPVVIPEAFLPTSLNSTSARTEQSRTSILSQDNFLDKTRGGFNKNNDSNINGSSNGIPRFRSSKSLISYYNGESEIKGDDDAVAKVAGGTAVPKGQPPSVPPSSKKPSLVKKQVVSRGICRDIKLNTPEYALIKLQAYFRAYNARINHKKKLDDLVEIEMEVRRNEKALKALVKIQALARGMVARHLPVVRAKRRRNEIVREILSTESSYVNSLEIMVEVYMKNLEALGETVLPAAKIKIIFSAIKVILGYNKVIEKQIIARMKEWYSKGQRLGDIFLTLSDFLKVYTAYVNNYNEAIYNLQELQISSPIIADTLAKCRDDPRVRGMELTSFLIMPIQRIPRYVLLLNDLFRNTPEDHEDYPDLKKALEKMEGVATYVNQKKKEAENLLGVSTVSKHLIAMENLNDFNQPHRRYVRQGLLQELDGNSAISQKSFKNRYYFLFNDILVCTKPVGGVRTLILKKKNAQTYQLDIEQLRNSEHQFKYLYSVSLAGAIINDIPASNDVNDAFELVTKERKIFFSSADKQTKNEWILDLDEIIMSCLEKARSRIEIPLSEERTSPEAQMLCTKTNFSPVEFTKSASITGSLFKRNESGEWKKKYFILNRDVLTYYPDILSSMSSTFESGSIIFLLFASVSQLPVMDRPFCFQLVTKSGILYLSSDTNHNRMQWINMIRSAISRRLSEIEAKLNESDTTSRANESSGGTNENNNQNNNNNNDSSNSIPPVPSTNDKSSNASNPNGAVLVSAGVCGEGADPTKVLECDDSNQKGGRAKDLANNFSGSSSTKNPADLLDNVSEGTKDLNKGGIGNGETNGEQSPLTTTTERSPPNVVNASNVGTERNRSELGDKVKEKEKKYSGFKKISLRHKHKVKAVKNISKVGEVFKQSSNKEKMRPYFLTLRDGKLAYSKGLKSKPSGIIDLLLVHYPLSYKIETFGELYTFSLTSAEKKFVFATASDETSRSWLETIDQSLKILNSVE